MPPRATNSARLQVFVSYATEDENVGRAIAEELRRAFGAILKVSIATEFRAGDFWRQDIEDALHNTSILLIVATGRQKLSHSFTGFEVGYFKASTKHRRKMTHLTPIGSSSRSPSRPIFLIQLPISKACRSMRRWNY